MTNPDYWHIIVIVDRSGSMHACRDAAEEAVNGLFAGQAKETGDGNWATASLYQFDNEHDAVFEHLPVGEAPPYRLVPRGGTALLDAIGFAFTREGEWLASLQDHERPGSVVVVIATDGMETQSREYTRQQVQEMIIHQQDAYAWKVLFIGANMDAVQVAGSYGIHVEQAMSFRATAAGVASSFESVNRALLRGRAGQGYAFTVVERAAALDNGN